MTKLEEWAAAELDSEGILVATDVFLERGDPRGEALQLEARLAELAGDAAARSEVCEELEALYRNHLQTWLPSRIRMVADAEIAIEPDDAVAPVKLEVRSGVLGMRGGFITELRSWLANGYQHIPDDLIIEVATDGELFPYLRRLELSTPEPLPTVLEQLLFWPRPRLRELSLTTGVSNWPIEASGDQAAKLSHDTPALTSLHLGGTERFRRLAHDSLTHLACETAAIVELQPNSFPNLKSLAPYPDGDTLSHACTFLSQLTPALVDFSERERLDGPSAFSVLEGMNRSRPPSLVRLPRLLDRQDVAELTDALGEFEATRFEVMRHYTAGPELWTLKDRDNLLLPSTLPWPPPGSRFGYMALEFPHGNRPEGLAAIELIADDLECAGLVYDESNAAAWERIWQATMAVRGTQVPAEVAVSDATAAFVGNASHGQTRLLVSFVAAHAECCRDQSLTIHADMPF